MSLAAPPLIPIIDRCHYLPPVVDETVFAKPFVKLSLVDIKLKSPFYSQEEERQPMKLDCQAPYFSQALKLTNFRIKSFFKAGALVEVTIYLN